VLFETAARLFNRFGFRGTSLSLITKELGLTKGALYHYVKDKSDLLYQLNLRSAHASRLAHERSVREGWTKEKVACGMADLLSRVIAADPKGLQNY